MRRMHWIAPAGVKTGLVFLVLSAGVDLGAQTQPKGATATPARFEVASIRMIPERDVVPLAGSPLSPPGSGLFTMRELTLANMIGWAFGLDEDQLNDGPDWLNKQCYDVSAKPEGDEGLSYEQIKPLMQQLLKERFHLAYHREAQSRKGYALVVAKGGSRLAPSKGGAQHGYVFAGRYDAANMPMAGLAGMLGHTLGQPVVDKTGLTGSYDVRIDFAPLDGTESSQPSIFAAVEEQLGLRLEKQTVPVEVLVIDHADRVPTEN